MEVSATNPFEMQAKLYAELPNDIFRYYSVPKQGLFWPKIFVREKISPCQISERFQKLMRFFSFKSY